jgi:hypothetical protein
LRTGARTPGDIDILVNNAGISMFGPTAEVEMAAYDKMFASNVRAPLFLVGALAPGPVERGRGSIISLSSMAGGVGLAALVGDDADASRLASRGHSVPRVRPRELHHRRDDRRRRWMSSGLDRHDAVWAQAHDDPDHVNHHQGAGHV